LQVSGVSDFFGGVLNCVLLLLSCLRLLDWLSARGRAGARVGAGQGGARRRRAVAGPFRPWLSRAAARLGGAVPREA